ncbi:hypothetical protein HCA15_04980 [Listeria booriae]|uniref:Imm6 family immunity protein n=1 Tax=Listeria booriae TaxID=1552123 RepID=UPI00164E99D4|nr:Imm6 family immunity protein [Listeria booriae]MBC6165995.1 hypothetical protein [Listeria booriae]
MIEQVEDICSSEQALLLLVLSEHISVQLSDSEDFSIARQALNTCWGWLVDKKIDPDSLYCLLENLDDTGILTVMQSEDDARKLKVWICIADAMVLILKEAYASQADEYLSATIEAVDMRTVEEFFDNFQNVCEHSRIIVNKVLTYLMEIDSDERINRTEILELVGICDSKSSDKNEKKCYPSM